MKQVTWKRRRLVLHIGSHKTGSTTLQRTLFGNRYHLLDQGWELFCDTQDGEVSRRGNVGGWVSFLPDGGVVHEGFAGRLAELESNVVVSSEGFSWLFDGAEVAKLAQQLQDQFDQIQVVAYIKRQDLMAVSHFQQASKNWPAKRIYVPGNRALPVYQESYRRLLDYNQRLSHWAEAFGADRITIRNSDRKSLVNGDVVDDFAEVTGMEFPLRLPWRNVSNGFEETKIGHLMNQLYTPKYLRRRIERVLDGSDKLRPSRAEAEAFYDHFRDSNRALNEKFRISTHPCLFEDDFSMYEEQASDTWTESRANDAIVRLFTGVRDIKVLNPKDEKVLKECAEAIRDNDPESAALMMELATRIRRSRR